MQFILSWSVHTSAVICVMIGPQWKKLSLQVETVIVCLFLRVRLGTKVPVIFSQTQQKSHGIGPIPWLFQKSWKNLGFFGPIITCYGRKYGNLMASMTFDVTKREVTAYFVQSLTTTTVSLCQRHGYWNSAVVLSSRSFSTCTQIHTGMYINWQQDNGGLHFGTHPSRFSRFLWCCLSTSNQNLVAVEWRLLLVCVKLGWEPIHLFLQSMTERIITESSQFWDFFQK